MSEAHASFRAGLETQGYTNVLRIIESETKKSTSRMSGEFSKLGKSVLGRQAGGISMQMADVAVQLQGGAKAATVIAQQGSQIAQYFGPAGQILAGVIAIGAGLFTWAMNADKANSKLEGTLSLLSEISKRQKDSQAAAQADARVVEKLSFGTGTNADIMRLKSEFDRDMKRMEAEFNQTPAHLQDRGIHNANVQVRTQRFNAERQALYDQRAEQAEQKRIRDEEAKESKRIQELRDHEAQQKQQFLDEQRKQQDDESEARKGLIDSIKEADRIQEENTKRNEQIASLQKQLGVAQAQRSIQNQASAGQSILDAAGEHVKPQSQRIAEREGRQAMARATEREISRRLDRADQHRRAIGEGGMTPEERADLRANERKNVQAARDKDKLLAALDEDSVERIVKAIDKLIPT